MSRTLNKVMMIGNVGNDPVLKYTSGGIPVVSIRLATTESWRDKDGTLQESTDWHTVVAWRGLAEIINKIVKKGSRIYIEGKLHSRTFDDEHNNKKHFVEIQAENMLLLDNKKSFKDDNYNDFDDVSNNYSNINDDDYSQSDSYSKNIDKQIPF